MKHEANSSGVEELNGACRCPDCRLPPQGPPAWLRAKAVPIWCGSYFAELAMEMGQDAAAECEAAFACGFEKGIVIAMLRPEWAQAFYLKLREYYLLTHDPEQLVVWEEEAEETCRAIPLMAVVPPPEDLVPIEGPPAGGDGHSDGAEAVIGPNDGA